MKGIIKVVSIITPYQIVLNVGSEDGTKLNDRFVVFGLGNVITDPDTGEEIERLEILRGKGKVIHVQNKICTIESTEYEEAQTRIKKSNPYMSLVMGHTEETEVRQERKSFDDVQLGDHARKL